MSWTIDRFAFFVPERKYILLSDGDLWPAEAVNDVVPQLFQVDGAEKPVSAAMWLRMFRQVHAYSWLPGQPEYVQHVKFGRRGGIMLTDAVTYNSYRPAELRPTPGNAKPWLDLVQRLYPDEADHLLDWFAWCVQRPDSKINHAIVLGGAPGIGKDSIIKPVIAAVGKHNHRAIAPTNLFDNFTDWAQCKLLVIQEAHDVGDKDKFKFHEKIKDYAASSSDVIRINDKNEKAYYVPNVLSIVITTNHRTDALYLPKDDRRHFVCWSEIEQSDFGNQAEYNKFWKDYNAWLDTGGNEIVLHYLTTRNVEFNPKAPPPKTRAFWAIVSASSPPEDGIIADILEHLKYPNVVTIADLIASTSERDKLADYRHIGHRLENNGYVRVDNPAETEGRWTVRKKRQAVYAKRSMTPEQRLAAVRVYVGIVPPPPPI